MNKAVNAGSFKKGEKRPNQGRPKGVTNKATKELKDMILAALAGVGGEEYLMRQAEESPTAFISLIGKVLPTTIKATVDATVTGSVSYKANIPIRGK